MTQTTCLDRHNRTLPNGHVFAVLATGTSTPHTTRPPPSLRHGQLVARSGGRRPPAPKYTPSQQSTQQTQRNLSQHTARVPDDTEDVDVEQNQGPDDNTPPQGMVRTLAQNFQRCTLENQSQNEDQQPRNSEEKSPETQGENPLQPLGDDTGQATPHKATAPVPSAPHNAGGFGYTSPSPHADTQAYTFHRESENPFDKLPIHTQMEFELIKELENSTR